MSGIIYTPGFGVGWVDTVDMVSGEGKVEVEAHLRQAEGSRAKRAVHARSVFVSECILTEGLKCIRFGVYSSLSEHLPNIVFDLI